MRQVCILHQISLFIQSVLSGELLQLVVKWLFIERDLMWFNKDSPIFLSTPKCDFILQNLLVETIVTKIEHHLKYILDDLKINPDHKQRCFGNLSLFEMVLITPDSRQLIEMCINYGSDFYQVTLLTQSHTWRLLFVFAPLKKNIEGLFALHYAIQSLNAENLRNVVITSAATHTE